MLYQLSHIRAAGPSGALTNPVVIGAKHILADFRPDPCIRSR